MQILQNKRSNKHSFTFSDDFFNFAMENKSGSDDVDLNYADMPKKRSIKIEQNEWLRNVGYLWCALGSFQLLYAAYLGDSLSGRGFWLMVGFVCLIWAHFSKVKYTIFKAERGTVYVIHDKNHDIIIDEIATRKKSQLLTWYGDVNLENDLESEINKFKWLAEQNVITKEESEKKIAQAELMNASNIGEPIERLN